MRRTLTFVVFAFLLGSGCTTIPKVEKVKAFGDAAAASSAVMKNALKANRVIAVRTSQEREADAYIRGQIFQLATNEKDERLIIKAPAQIATLQALEEYSQALVLAADQGIVDELEDAAVKLGAAAGTAIAAASPMAAPVIGPALKIPARLFGLALGNQYAAEIQAVIVARDPDVQRLTAQLIEQMAGVSALISGQVLNYEIKRHEVLKTVRSDRRVTRLELYKEYMTARTDLDTIKAEQAVIANYQNILGGLAEAHHALATNTADTAQILANFISLTNDITDVLKAVRAANGG